MDLSSSWLRHPPHKRNIPGSSPGIPTNLKGVIMITKTMCHRKRSTKTWINDPDKEATTHYDIVAVSQYCLFGIPIFTHEAIVHSYV